MKVSTTTLITLTMCLFVFSGTNNAAAQSYSSNYISQAETTFYKNVSGNSAARVKTNNQEMYNRVRSAYYNALYHEINGVTEASIYNIVTMKLKGMDANYSEYIAKLQKLTVEADTPRERTMAFIAQNYLRNADVLDTSSINPDDYSSNNYDELFQKMGKIITQNWVTVRTSTKN